MDLSPADRLVIDKLLRKAKSEIREPQSTLGTPSTGAVQQPIEQKRDACLRITHWRIKRQEAEASPATRPGCGSRVEEALD
jgi:hypothetical protein